MIIVSVLLISANDGSVQELARAEIVNDGTGTQDRRHYDVRTLRGRGKPYLERSAPTQRKGRVENWPSERRHVWDLVVCALHAMKYFGDRS